MLLEQKPKSASATRLLGQVICGAWVSSTLTVKLQLLLLPELSLAVQVTVVTPRGKVEPLGGTQTILVTAQLSVAVGV